jgi:hypothetical protein
MEVDVVYSTSYIIKSDLEGSARFRTFSYDFGLPELQLSRLHLHIWGQFYTQRQQADIQSTKLC